MSQNATFQRKSNAAMLAMLKNWYPAMTAFAWNADGTANFTSSVALSAQDLADINTTLVGPDSWVCQ